MADCNRMVAMQYSQCTANCRPLGSDAVAIASRRPAAPVGCPRRLHAADCARTPRPADSTRELGAATRATAPREARWRARRLRPLRYANFFRRLRVFAPISVCEEFNFGFALELFRLEFRAPFSPRIRPSKLNILHKISEAQCFASISRLRHS